MSAPRKKIAVDFDGTCVEHRYPDIGDDVHQAVYYLKQLAEHADLILWTVRTEQSLREAVDWFEERGIPLAGVNRMEGQQYWAGGPKVYAGLYIDDAALGAPLTHFRCLKPRRPVFDWTVGGPLALEWARG